MINLLTKSLQDKSAKPQDRATEGPTYAYPEKALQRWARDLLTIDYRENGNVLASFAFEGSTCNNGGIPIKMSFSVEINADPNNPRIESMQCDPAEGHRGYQSMCSFIQERAGLMSRINDYKPLLGQLLPAVLTWRPVTNIAGCLCTREHQDHKWLMVLQTIHYALAQNKI